MTFSFTGQQSATAESIFTKMDDVLQSNQIPWTNCVGAGVDNTSVNLGKRNSIMTRVLQQNPATYFMGCPCHIVHNTALKASASFTQVSWLNTLPHAVIILINVYLPATKFDFEELLIDTYYYFDKSTKRKSGLAEYCTFCDTQYRKILKHVSNQMAQPGAGSWACSETVPWSTVILSLGWYVIHVFLRE